MKSFTRTPSTDRSPSRTAGRQWPTSPLTVREQGSTERQNGSFTVGLIRCIKQCCNGKAGNLRLSGSWHMVDGSGRLMQSNADLTIRARAESRTQDRRPISRQAAAWSLDWLVGRLASWQVWQVDQSVACLLACLGVLGGWLPG